MIPTCNGMTMHRNTFDLEPEVETDWYLLRKSWRLAQMMFPIPAYPPTGTIAIQHARPTRRFRRAVPTDTPRKP